MAFSGSQKTRLGLSAIPRSLYGSFAGKAEAGDEGPPKNTGMLKNVGRFLGSR